MFARTNISFLDLITVIIERNTLLRVNIMIYLYIDCHRLPPENLNGIFCEVTKLHVAVERLSRFTGNRALDFIAKISVRKLYTVLK